MLCGGAGRGGRRSGCECAGGVALGVRKRGFGDGVVARGALGARVVCCLRRGRCAEGGGGFAFAGCGGGSGRGEGCESFHAGLLDGGVVVEVLVGAARGSG